MKCRKHPDAEWICVNPQLDLWLCGVCAGVLGEGKTTYAVADSTIEAQQVRDRLQHVFIRKVIRAWKPNLKQAQLNTLLYDLSEEAKGVLYPEEPA
jgi:hypothetical protein